MVKIGQHTKFNENRYISDDKRQTDKISKATVLDSGDLITDISTEKLTTIF